MIPTYLQEYLIEIFSTIDFSLSEGGQLAINEWEIGKEEGDVSITDEVNYDEYNFVINAMFERDVYLQLVNDSTFFNLIKDKFVINSRNTSEEENKRIKLIMVLRQAVMTC